MFNVIFGKRESAVTALAGEIEKGKAESGDVWSPNGVDWYAHARKGATQWCVTNPGRRF